MKGEFTHKLPQAPQAIQVYNLQTNSKDWQSLYDPSSEQALSKEVELRPCHNILTICVDLRDMSLNIKFQLNSQSHKERWQSTVMIIMLPAMFGENTPYSKEKKSYFDAKPSFEAAAVRWYGVLLQSVLIAVGKSAMCIRLSSATQLISQTGLQGGTRKMKKVFNTLLLSNHNQGNMITFVSTVIRQYFTCCLYKSVLKWDPSL